MRFLLLIIFLRSDLVGFSRIWSHFSAFDGTWECATDGPDGTDNPESFRGIREIRAIRGQKCFRSFQRGVRKRNCRSALQNAARARRGGVFPPSILRTPCSGLSSRQSWGDYGTSGNKPKTFHRFSGTIFLGGVGSALVIERQWVAMGKIPKNWENAKKSAKYFPWDIRFSAKMPLLVQMRSAGAPTAARGGAHSPRTEFEDPGRL